jgi:hypothetical protein
MTTLAWIGADMEQVPFLRDLRQRLERKAPGKGIAAALKVSNPSLRYLASYARIAIHGGGFSPEVAGNHAWNAQ